MKPTNSVYKRGASDGLVMGVIMMMVFILQAIGVQWLPLLWVGNILTLAVPIAAYIMLRRSYREEPGLRSFSAVWMHGIVIFLCGGLILGLTVYVYLRFIDTEFVVSQMQAAADVLRHSGDSESLEAADTIDNVISHRMVPTPIAMAFSSIWLSGFFGAMLSMLIAGIIKMFPPKGTQKTR